MASTTTATASPAGAAATPAIGVRSDDCDWCGQNVWRFRCRQCDPRKEKHVCLDCTTRWHARGFSQHHVLEDRVGTKHSYLQWLAHILSDAVTCATKPTASVVASMSDETAAPTSVKDHVTASNEALPPTEHSNGAVPVASIATSQAKTGASDGKDAEEAEYAHDHDSGSGGAEDEQDTEEVPQEIPAPMSDETQLDLEDVLDRLPSEDRSILNALADHIYDVIRIEDAILCAVYAKCEAPACQTILIHHRHVKDRKLCPNPMCQSIVSYQTHMEFCKRQSCPFCVRIRQRRLFGKKQGLDHLIQIHRRQLQTLRRDGGDQAQVNFAQDQITVLEQKKNRATDAVEVLNRLVLNEKLPMLNFPRFSWHANQEPLIKLEPGLEVKTSPPERSDVAPDGEEKISEGPTSGTTPHQDGSATSAADPSPASPSGEALSDDYVANLIMKKDRGDTAAQAMLDESVQHAFRIVDAAFCSPAKASRCLLNCHIILQHLQHHVDLKVCNERMCETVEQHFSHVSKCQGDGTDRSCEYCLRVTEREFARAVEVMEAERPETELKIQRLINGITDSLTNDPRDECEQNVMQLEDELQQAEDYKKALMKKIDAASLNLVKARRRMKHHPGKLASSFSTGLPLHFIKTAPPTATPSSSSKRHRA